MRSGALGGFEAGLARLGGGAARRVGLRPRRGALGLGRREDIGRQRDGLDVPHHQDEEREHRLAGVGHEGRGDERPGDPVGHGDREQQNDPRNDHADRPERRSRRRPGNVRRPPGLLFARLGSCRRPDLRFAASASR